jgi:chromosome segregation ATPase
MSENNHEVQETVVTESNHGAPGWVTVAVVILAIVSVVALGMGYSASNRANSIEQGLTAQLQPDVKGLHDSVDILSKRLKQAEETTAQSQGELSVVTDRLKLTQGELARARKQGKQFQEQNSKNLEEMESAVRTELATKASTEQVNNLNGDVSGVRSDLESTKQNLQMAKGEMGTLIARNHEEIDQLRRLGQREYFEFTLNGKGNREKLGSILVELRGTNTKRNQFTLALVTDDLRLEKKNRSVNEPIYFYTRGSRTPLELVVNEVGKNKIIGYLSVPKVFAASAGK